MITWPLCKGLSLRQDTIIMINKSNFFENKPTILLAGTRYRTLIGASILTFTLMLTGCGSDEATGEVNVTVVDGYVRGATVKDANGNLAFDNDNGTYSFFKTPAYPISSLNGTSVETGDAFTGDLITGSDDANMYAPAGTVISPITTFLTTITNNKATTTLNSSLSAKLAALLGVTEATLVTDFVASGNLELAKTAQALHLVQQSPQLRACFSSALLNQSTPNFAGIRATIVSCMTTGTRAGTLSDIKQTVYTQILDDVDNYAGTAAGLEAGIDASKSMLENIASIEILGGDIGGDISSLQTALALVDLAGSGDATKSITAAQLSALGVSDSFTNNADSVTLMVDVIRQSTVIKYDSKAELEALETHISHFVAVDTQQGGVSDALLLAAYKVILDDTSISAYKQIYLAALTNATATVSANTVAAVQSLYDNGTINIAAPVLTVTAVPLNENAGTGQVIANASATFATGSQLGVFSLNSSGDYASLTIDAATGVVTVNADPDYETKASYVFTVKVTSVLVVEDLLLAVGEDSAITTVAITNMSDAGISGVVYSYGAENADAHAIGATNGQTDNTEDNQLIITFNADVDAFSLAPQNFSITTAGTTTALASDLMANYTSATKTYAITIGATIINLTSGFESTITSGITTLANGAAFDSGFDSKKVEARTIITHDNVSYNTVKSPDTANYWLDRNLGASQVATSSTDAESFGHLYQWGRPSDGHEEVVDKDWWAATRRSLSIIPPIDSRSQENFFIVNYSSPHDWVKNTPQDGVDVDDSGALRSAFWARVDGSGICPVGFRVPTDTELAADTNNATTIKVTDKTTGFNSFLKLPVPGYRMGKSMTIYSPYDSVGIAGGYWSSSANEYLGRFFFLDSDMALLTEQVRVNGFSVRCIKD